MANNDNWEDMPYDAEPIPICLRFRDRLSAICMDRNHCTIANAINGPFGREVGILSFEYREAREGVGRTYANVRFDPAIVPWAKAGVIYRCRLDDNGRRITIELDSYWNRPKQDKELKQSLRELTKRFGDEGLDAVYSTIWLMPPCLSQRKDYKAGKHGSETRKTHQKDRKSPDQTIPNRPGIERQSARRLKRTPRVGA